MNQPIEPTAKQTLNVEQKHFELFERSIAKVIQGAESFDKYVSSKKGGSSFPMGDDDDEEGYEQGYESWEAVKQDGNFNKLAFCLHNSMRLFIATRELVRQEGLADFSINQPQVQEGPRMMPMLVGSMRVPGQPAEGPEQAAEQCNCPVCVVNRHRAAQHGMTPFEAIPEASAFMDDKDQPPQVHAATNMLFSTASYALSLVSQEQLDKIWGRVKELIFEHSQLQRAQLEPVEQTAQDPTQIKATKIFTKLA
jgi:hypothetical protein